MQPWMLWAKSHQSWMQEPWSPSWMESPWEHQKEQKLTIQQWLRLMKRYINKSGKLQFWLEPPKHMWTYMWLIGWPPNWRIQYLRPWLSGSLTGMYRIWNTCLEMMQILRRENYPLRIEEADTLPRSPLPSPHTNWWVWWGFVVCSLLGSSISCHEWMSARCWTHRVSNELCTCYVTGSGGQEWPHKCRRWSATVSNVSNMKVLIPKPQCNPSLLLLLWSCYTLTLPVLRQLWSWINPQMCRTFWSLWPLYKTHHGICDPQSNCKNHC